MNASLALLRDLTCCCFSQPFAVQKQKITVTVLAFTGILLLSGVFIASSSARRAASAADQVKQIFCVPVDEILGFNSFRSLLFPCSRVQFAHVSAAGAHGGASATQLDNMVTLEMETTTSKQQHLRQGGSSHGSGSDNGADNGSGAGAGSDGARRTIPGTIGQGKRQRLIESSPWLLAVLVGSCLYECCACACITGPLPCCIVRDRCHFCSLGGKHPPLHP